MKNEIICATCNVDISNSDPDLVLFHAQGGCVPEKSTIKYWPSVVSCYSCNKMVPIVICKDSDLTNALIFEGKKIVLSRCLGVPTLCNSCERMLREELEKKSFAELWIGA